MSSVELRLLERTVGRFWKEKHMILQYRNWPDGVYRDSDIQPEWQDVPLVKLEEQDSDR